MKEKKPIRRDIKIGQRWYKQIFYHIPQFKLIHIYGSDATERKNAEKNLRESEKRYRSLFEKMNYGYVLYDIVFDHQGKPVDYRFADVNKAFEKIIRLKRSFFIGKTVSSFGSDQNSKESIRLRKICEKVILTGKPAYFENYNENLKKYFEVYAYRPNKTRMALIFSDITNRKKMDEEKNNFISIMSHELRNPLTPIMANAQFISSTMKQQNIKNPIIKESVEVIEKESKIMASLLNDILDVSRFSRQKIQLEKVKINLCDILRHSIKSSMPFITTKNQKLSLSFAKDPIYMIADPLRIEQIIVNITNNASKYTQEGGSIKIFCQAKEDIVHISIKDNGIGMDSQKISRVFELFNGDSQPFMGIGGLGIGLNIVKNLVSMHKGTISVTSKGENQGSEFIISLPVGKTDHLSQISTYKKAPLIKKASKILVVEDNEDIRNAVAKILRQYDHAIKVSHNGALAIKISKFFKPDTALIDIGLPDMDGYKVAKILRTQHQDQTPKIKLIAFTGYGQVKDKKLSKQAGFDHHVTKPIDMRFLLKLV